MVINQCNQVPHFLKGDKFVLAVLKLFVVGALHIEKRLKIIEFFSFIFESAGFVVEVSNLLIGIVNDFRTGLSNVERTVVAELNSEFLNNDTEASETSLDVFGLSVLEGKDRFLNWTESLFSNVFKAGLVGFKNNEEIFLHLDLVLLHKHDSLFHWLDHIKSLIFDHLDITEVSHYSHKSGTLSRRLVTLRYNFDTFRNISDELFNVSNLLSGIVEQEVSVSSNPKLNCLLKFLDQR